MKFQRNVIKLTDVGGKPILIGTESIIKIETVVQNSANTTPPHMIGKSKITSREAMVTTTWVNETIEEIYNQIENK